MKYILALIVVFYSSLSLAIGWREISKSDSEVYSLALDVEFDSRNFCYRVKASFPHKLKFDELGERQLWKIRLLKIESKERGWQLMSKGTAIELPITSENRREKVGELCLSESDLKHGYLSVVYGGPEGTPPMVLLVNLSEFK